MKYLSAFLLVLFAFSLVTKGDGQLGEVVPPPADEVERLSLDPFYEKYLSYKGFPIVSSGKVSDYALKEAAFLIEQMIGDREDIMGALIENKVRLAIMAPDEFTTDIPEHATLEPKAYWDKRARGLGASQERPAVSAGEENLLNYPGDPYSIESIMIHEFAHAIHLMGLNTVDPGFQDSLEQAFNRAAIAGLWKGKYAGINPAEYWAEGVQSWFNTNRENDHDHNHVNTREELKQYDNELAALIESVFGDDEWVYVAPRDRGGFEGHLSGYELSSAPKFSWPEEMVKAYEALDQGDGLERIELQPMRSFKPKDTTVESGRSVTLRFDNKSNQRISIFWVGFDGIRRPYSKLDPGRKYDQHTYGYHLWIVVGEEGRDLGWLRAPTTDSRVEVK